MLVESGSAVGCGFPKGVGKAEPDAEPRANDRDNSVPYEFVIAMVKSMEVEVEAGIVPVVKL